MSQYAKDTQTFAPTPKDLAKAAALLAKGELVAFPTETVYGLGGDATSDLAVAAIFAAKGRPAFNPLIVHVPDLAAARLIATFPPEAETLAKAFWPGPLTLVLPLRANAAISTLVSAGLATVALRVPAHPVAQSLLRAAARPLAAPSANPSGRLSPTTAAHVLSGLGGRIAAVVDGGACAVGLESTIIGLAGPATLLRPGGLTIEALEAALGHRLLAHQDDATISAPGQLASHYAPQASLRLNAHSALPGEILIGFGSVASAMSLSASGNLAEAAANLFATLRLADDQAGPNGRIAVASIPQAGLGLAINDRLRRAAAPRP